MILFLILTVLFYPKPVFAHNGIPDEPLGQAIFYGLPILLMIFIIITALKNRD